MSNEAANALASVDFSKAAEELRDKIRSSFIDLIPDEQWDALIKNEFTKFLSETARYGSSMPSPLSSLCNEVLKEEAHKRIKEVLSSDGWQKEWGAKISEQVKSIIIDNRDKFVEAMLVSMMGAGIETALDSMRINKY